MDHDLDIGSFLASIWEEKKRETDSENELLAERLHWNISVSRHRWCGVYCNGEQLHKWLFCYTIFPDGSEKVEFVDKREMSRAKNNVPDQYVGMDSLAHLVEYLRGAFPGCLTFVTSSAYIPRCMLAYRSLTSKDHINSSWRDELLETGSGRLEVEEIIRWKLSSETPSLVDEQ